MFSIKATFTRAARGGIRIHFSLFALVLLGLTIDDDRQRAEKPRKKRTFRAMQKHKPAGPRPF